MGMEVGRQAGPPRQSSEGHFRGRRPFQGGPQNGTGAPESEEASIPGGGQAPFTVRRANPGPKLVRPSPRRLHLWGLSWERRGPWGRRRADPERPGPAAVPALLDLRVSLELQQFQLLGHEALHRCRGHGRSPARAQSRGGPAAARGAAPGRTRCVDAPGSRHFRFRCGKMAAAVAARALPVTFGRLAFACSRSVLRASGPGAASLWSASRRFGSQSASSPQGYVPKTSLSSPPWPEVVLPDPVEEARHHTEVVEKVNELIARGQYGRLFAVVHFASHQWKVTSEDLILIENKLDIACGERIRLEKVLLVGADDFTLLGRPLLGKDLVRVEATVIEKTESWPRVNMRFQKRKNYKRKRIIVNPQTVLRINTIEIAPRLC
uniref:Large ribosomal subunit protein bL21m n=2 Tax=Bos TaxID=9903 RepID=A0A4W2I3I4_BOBOX